MMSARVAGTTRSARFRPTRSYTNPRDVTSRGHCSGHARRRRGTLASIDRAPAYDPFVTEHAKQRPWTAEEVRREEDAQRARVRRDGARGVSENLKDAVAHTEFAKRFADAF